MKKNNLKCLHICTIDRGGAFNGAKRLNEMLRKNGIESNILVRTKTGDSPEVIPAFDNIFDDTVSKIKNVINLACKKGELKRDILGTDLRNNKWVQEADVIFLHWISTFLSPKQIYEISCLSNKLIIFWMHDMWLFTGGCHVDRRCGGYDKGCINCPMAGKWAISSFRRKEKYIQKSNLQIVGPSRWIVDEAKRSNIVKGKQILYIPNTYNDSIFYPSDNIERIKKDLGLKEGKKYLLFGAADAGTSNSNKGFSYLLEALDMIDMSNKQLIVIGKADGVKENLRKYDAVFPGFISDENRLADIYRVADVFVNPSLQESFGYTVCESMACGTPAVAFAVGGMLDQIKHMKNGYHAKFMDSADLARGIEFCISNETALSVEAAESAKRFNYDSVFKEINKLLNS